VHALVFFLCSLVVYTAMLAQASCCCCFFQHVSLNYTATSSALLRLVGFVVWMQNLKNVNSDKGHADSSGILVLEEDGEDIMDGEER